MQVKKVVYDRVVQVLQDEKNKIVDKIRVNKYTFQKLRDEQTVLKRERAKIDEIIRSAKV
jgi:hypothetical protein